jgi:hypothetical protein
MLVSFYGSWTVIEAPKATQLAVERDACLKAGAAASAADGGCADTIARADAAAATSGFFGSTFTFNSGNTFDVTVRDGQTYVAGYFYTESTARVVQLGPGSGLSPKGGLVTVAGPKHSPYFPDGVQANGWVGNFTLLQTEIGAQLNNPWAKPPVLQPFTVSSTIPPAKGSNILIMGNAIQVNAPKMAGAEM